MKKFILIVLALCIYNLPVFASHCYTCRNIPQTSDNVMTAIEKISGIEYLSVQATECYWQNYIKKNFQNDVKINIKTKNLHALKNLEFKEVSAKAKKLKLSNVTVSDFYVKTICPYNKIDVRNEKAVFPYDLPAEFSAVITNEDLQTITNSQNSKNKSPFGIQNVIWRIENSRIKVTIDLAALLVNTRITFSTGLKINNGKIVLISPSGVSSSLGMDVNKFLPYLNVHSPFSYVLRLAENTHSYIDLDYLNIDGDKIYLKGIFLIPQNCDIKS